MADDTMLVYGFDGSWKDCAKMDTQDFEMALSYGPDGKDPARYHAPASYLHTVPRAVWDHWQKAREEYFAVMHELNESPRVDLVAVREAITSAAHNGNGTTPR